MKNFETILKEWNKNVFGYVHINVKIISCVFDVIHEQIDAHDYSDALMEQEKNVMIAYDQILKVKEIF